MDMMREYSQSFPLRDCDIQHPVIDLHLEEFGIELFNTLSPVTQQEKFPMKCSLAS